MEFNRSYSIREGGLAVTDISFAPRVGEALREAGIRLYKPSLFTAGTQDEIIARNKNLKLVPEDIYARIISINGKEIVPIIIGDSFFKLEKQKKALVIQAISDRFSRDKGKIVKLHSLKEHTGFDKDEIWQIDNMPVGQFIEKSEALYFASSSDVIK